MKARYHVVKPRLTPRVYMAKLEDYQPGTLAVEWTVDVTKARRYALPWAQMIAARNKCEVITAAPLPETRNA